MTLNTVIALILRYFTEFTSASVSSDFMALYKCCYYYYYYYYSHYY